MSGTVAADSAQRRPRLLVLASTYPRWHGDPEPGFVHELSQRLVADFDVRVLCPHAAGALPRECMDGVDVIRYRYAPARWERLVNDGGIVGNLRHRPWTALLLPSFLLGQLWSLLRMLCTARPDVIHAHWILPQGLMVALLQMVGIRTPPTLVTSHGADLFSLRGRFPMWIKRLTVRRMQASSVVSSAMLGPMLALGADPDSLAVASMGVDLQHRFTPDTQMQRAGHELLFVGRLVEKKGLTHLLDALPLVLQRHPQAKLSIAGFGPELAHCQQQVERLGLQEHVRFLGALSQDALPNLYRRSSMLITPFVQARSGDQEGLGLVMVEALGCGCPVVTTRLPAIRELRDGQWPPYLAEPGDACSLAAQINALLDDPAAGQTWVQQLRPSLMRRFDHAAVAAGYSARLAALAGAERTPQKSGHP
ncbi:glycosyltransferase family 4 protein [Stenotrophomonas rhizophila]|uniref:glycosyltransferase family 4 protein n=1 Tax=Stenotrophomonas rhizophila TaxID=216778 RepID=UPI001E537EA2|nr:glycosyltransferase family 4 protein [Stenotrophomonas rhizophila]MCC7635773.1 glycosyltransferase family 4 protein [Stenotrophomonas rhizophila]MCC7665040.1 glycosyltransferase family 4 protein [Stenotrophomonas rhizophila]